MIASIAKAFTGGLDQKALIWGAIGISLFLLWGSAVQHGAQGERAKNNEALIVAIDKTADVQANINESVGTQENTARVRRVHVEKKVADAVAQIQDPSAQTDPVLIWASAIDGLRNEAKASDSAAIEFEPFDGHAEPMRPALAA